MVATLSRSRFVAVLRRHLSGDCCLANAAHSRSEHEFAGARFSTCSASWLRYAAPDMPIAQKPSGLSSASTCRAWSYQAMHRDKVVAVRINVFVFCYLAPKVF